MAEEFEITGKSKLIIDESGYYNAKRSPSDGTRLSLDLGTELYSGVYFSPVGNIDKVRVVSGKHWDFHPINEKPTFSSDWGGDLRFKSFAGNYISLEACGLWRPLDESGLIIDQEFMLKGTFTPTPDLGLNEAVEELNGAAQRWAAYIKTGLDDHNPIVKSGHYFYDHYHSTFVPFTPDELIKKQPAGKAYYADYKTYYNERLDSANYEKITGLSVMQNSLPNIYGFIRMVKNELLLEDGNFELTKLLNVINDWLKPYPNKKTQTKDDVYNSLLQKYPLETLTLLYGAIANYRTNQLTDELEYSNPTSNQLLEKIINFDFKKHDASALFEEYFDTFTKLTELQEFEVPADGPWKVNKISVLERVMSRIVFNPEFIPIMDKVDQYKKYFPYYVDLQFTAKRLTSLGDLMEKLFLTRYLSYKMVAFKNKSLDFDSETKDSLQYVYGITDSWCPGADCDEVKSFIEFTNETIYDDLFPSQAEFNAASLNLSPYSLSDASGKRTLDLMPALEEFSSDKVIDPHLDVNEYSPDNDFFRDIRNYVTFVRDDFENSVSLTNEDNTIFKMLCGTAFRMKVLDIYKKKQRTYEDILNGKSAYSEDLFYRIEKWAKKNEPNAEWKIVQHIIIPNTSKLDVARYVDTQLKYCTYATYKYNVYSMRVVFGNKYKYLWGKSTDNENTPFVPGSIQTFTHSPSGLHHPDVLAGRPTDETSEVFDGMNTPVTTLTEGECVDVGQQVSEEYWEFWHYYGQSFTAGDNGRCDCSDGAAGPPRNLSTGGQWYQGDDPDLRGSPTFLGEPWVSHAKAAGTTGRECTSEAMAVKMSDSISDHFLKGEPWPSNVADPPFFKAMTREITIEKIECAPSTTNLPQAVGGKYEFAAKFLVRLEPSIQIIEDKVFSTPEVLIMDRPPMPPDVDIIPYRAVNNKLKFLMRGTSGRKKEKPIIILESDKEKFDLVKRGQLVTSPLDSSPLEGQEIEFATDDPVRKFQIFRIRTKPKTYGNFELYRQVNGMVFEEEILPNTKYYYTFRSIDLHEHISNPSPVYEVELIDEKGAVKPVIKLISIEPEEPKTFAKDCQKYIYLKPSLRQLNFSEQENEESIFSIEDKKKKYKLRLSSKGSGKKIDINFSFAKIPDPDQ